MDGQELSKKALPAKHEKRKKRVVKWKCFKIVIVKVFYSNERLGK